MQTILDIVSTLYRVVNVSAVTSIIGGEVSRGASENSTLDNVEIIAGANVNDIVQDATLFVNYHVQNLNSGQANSQKMRTFAVALVALIEATDFTIIDEQIFQNEERPGWAFYSARIRVNAMNDSYVE